MVRYLMTHASALDTLDTPVIAMLVERTQQAPSPGSIRSGFVEVFLWLNYEHPEYGEISLLFFFF